MVLFSWLLGYLVIEAVDCWLSLLSTITDTVGFVVFVMSKLISELLFLKIEYLLKILSNLDELDRNKGLWLLLFLLLM